MSLDLSVLNPEQRKAVVNIEGPCMIVAGAGSGKTRVLTYKIAYLIDSGVSPYEILALTFTNKAAGEMKQRVINLTGDAAQKMWIGTFHSIFARILRFEADKLGYSRSFSIYDDDDSISLIKKIMLGKGISVEKFNPYGIQSVISAYKTQIILPEHLEPENSFEKTFLEIYTDYQSLLKQNNAMDFDDLLIKPIELFERYPDVLEKYQERFKFILVDEYQDTNHAQYIALKLLSSKYFNISIVGDDAQSIYRWRGAKIDNIFDFQREFKNVKLFKLEQNYRSTKMILAVADDIIKKNKKRIEKNLWTANKEGEKVHIIEMISDRDEAFRIAKLIKEEMHSKKINFKDIAILYRTNAQSRSFEETFRNNSIPYNIVGGIKFYQRKEIKDILSYLKVIANSNDNEALLRALNLREGIGKATIEKIQSIAKEKNISLYKVLEDIQNYIEVKNGIKNTLIHFSDFIKKYITLKDELKVHEFVSGIIDEIGIIPKLKLENTSEADERINNIQEFKSAVREYYDTNENPTLEGFLEQVSLITDIDELDDKKNAVTLMTAHSAKGLEFSVVFITGLEDGLFPLSSSFDIAEELEEERRLFYVAVTRAKEKLYITYSNQRYRYGELKFQLKSRFLSEISQDVLDKCIVYEKFSKNKLFLDQEAPAVNISIFKNKNITNNRDQTIVYDYNLSDDCFSDIRAGVKVFHNTFGSGVVQSVSGNGLEKRAVILFNDFGLKKIVLKYAKLRVMDN
ncbi:MAG: UvrD-helicase domain-containing protein [Ignavibacteria bacterium]|nr:UvrD-helicase domain-containing protein [Ignavibacteria bacterium]